jgi:ParB-like chromosome segregation protein Spo0J
MRDVELEALAGDIAEKGLLNPVVLLDGKVLDGRNRLRACAKAGVEPLFTKWHENGLSALDFVIAQNLQRRDLTFDQRVALAAKLVPMFAAQARKRVGGRPRKRHEARGFWKSCGPRFPHHRSVRPVG